MFVRRIPVGDEITGVQASFEAIFKKENKQGTKRGRVDASPKRGSVKSFSSERDTGTLASKEHERARREICTRFVSGSHV